MYEIFEHTADLGLRVRAPTVDQLFADAARGLFALLVTNSDPAEPLHARSCQIEGNELDLLLLDWLSELLFWFETEHLVMTDFQMHIGEDGMRAVCRGEPLDPARHQSEHELKAITYHGLKVEQQGDEWLAEVIVDI